MEIVLADFKKVILSEILSYLRQDKTGDKKIS